MPPESEIRSWHEAQIRVGELPPVTAVAEHFGITNATFWRSFPDLAQQIADARKSVHREPRAAAGNDFVSVKDELARLRRERTELGDQLEIAAAEVRRLTLENARLRNQLETASAVRKIHS